MPLEETAITPVIAKAAIAIICSTEEASINILG
jgi:hypothetical protein